MPTSIGFIGLGSLGTPIALNLLESGHALMVYNRTSAKAAPLADKGAEVCPSIEALAAQCQIVFTLVSDDNALREVMSSGLLQHLPQGGIHVSMSTILPKTAGDLATLHAAQGQHYVAAPVFGRPDAAAARKLNVVMSGPVEICKQVSGILRDAGALGVWEFGEDVMAANTVKLCGNFLIASALEAIGESVSLASGSGVDAVKMWDMFSKTLFSAPVYQNYSRIILNRLFEPAAFTAKLGLKDLNLVLDQAKQAGQFMPLAALLQKNMTQLVQDQGPEMDWSAISLGSTGDARPASGDRLEGRPV